MVQKGVYWALVLPAQQTLQTNGISAADGLGDTWHSAYLPCALCREHRFPRLFLPFPHLY